MPAEYDFIVRQTSLLMTRTRGADSIDKEAIRSNWGLETLRSTPSHAVQTLSSQVRNCTVKSQTLNRNPGTLGDVIEVSKTMNDDSPAALLNDTRQDTQRRRARVLAQEYIVRRTLLPGNVRCVNSRLYIRPIKVEGVSLLIEERAAVYQVIRRAKPMKGMGTYGKPRTSQRMGYWVEC
jgi:hypothetical protein